MEKKEEKTDSLSAQDLDNRLREIAALSADIDLQVQQIRESMVPIIAVYRKQIAPYEAQLTAASKAYGRLNVEKQQLQEALKVAKEVEAKKRLITATASQVSKQAEVMQKSASPLVQNLGQVMKLVAVDERFTAVLPDLIEQDLRFYGRTNNGCKIAVGENSDKCRITTIADGSFVVGYYPQSGSAEQSAAFSALAEFDVPAGYRLNEHFIGFRVETNTKDPNIHAVALLRGIENKRDVKTVFLPMHANLTPVIDAVSSILAEGNISLLVSGQRNVIERSTSR